MDLNQYIETVSKRYQSGISREHAYRADLEALIRALVTDVEITNEPANVTDCGNPDYVITKKNIPIGFIEAKDVGKDLNSKQYKPQFDRYRKALDNLIITDYIRFQFYQYGQLVHEIRIAEIEHEQVVACPDSFAEFTMLVQNFCTYVGQTIRSSKKLAGMMAAKAHLLQIILEKAITSDEQTQDNTAIQQQFNTFKDILIHDLTPAGFADIYAQTLAYGMFAARLNDQTLDTFSRQEAAELIPKSNPFLRKLFAHVAGVDIDERIRVTVDNLADLFRATDINALLKNFGRATQTNDPIIHFYETFLAEYNPKLRKSRGVWYTPEPVVSFIVRGVDEILKTEFDLKDGFADTSKTTIKLKLPTTDKRKKVNGQSGYIEVEKEVHKVQVLDPATGTGTFLAEVVKFIYNGKFKAMQGAWSGYVDEHLIPRLNGFELLMASYAMAHLKLEMLLHDTGYISTDSAKRLNIYLTNSLEEHHPDTGTLFSSWLSSEANEANHIKRDTPVMVVMGNPPYSGESANKGDWIMQLMQDYKKEPGGKEKLKERNPKWINDDYVKFIRYGQHFIEKNGEGILAFINPHGFLDNPTFRGMRWNLLKTFDKIYTIDLHGNSKKKETAPDGSKDVNVFDIMQGVAITFFIKKKPIHAVTPATPQGGLSCTSAIHLQAGVQTTPMDSRLRGNDEGLAEVHHFDLYGERKAKYEFLLNNSLDTIGFNMLPNVAPMYYMIQKDNGAEKKYSTGFSVAGLFTINAIGIVTARDTFTIHHNKGDVKKTVERFLRVGDEEARNEFKLGKDVRDWRVSFARIDLEKSGPDFSRITSICYRPFDNRYTYYTGRSKGFHCYPRNGVMQHFFQTDNVGFCFNRKIETNRDFCDVFAVSGLFSLHALSLKESNSIAPLYIYSKEGNQQSLDGSSERKPNLDAEIVEAIAEGLSLDFVPEKNPPQSPFAKGEAHVTGEEIAPLLEKEGQGEICQQKTFAPIDLLDYIYAVLHSPSYRKIYKEFLKIDFPRIPYPKDTEVFWQLVKLGGELRQVHLLESATVENFITSYPQGGDNVVTRKIVKKDWEVHPVRHTREGGYPSSETMPESMDSRLRGNDDVVGRIWINDEQYFDQIPLTAWGFYIGGYQPAQKWLKDRSGRKLSYDDILHYQKIIVALTETDRLMQEINRIDLSSS